MIHFHQRFVRVKILQILNQYLVILMYDIYLIYNNIYKNIYKKYI